MSVHRIIQECERRNITLHPGPGFQLRYRGPRDQITDDLIQELKLHKAELIPTLLIMEIFQGQLVSGNRTLH